MHPFRQFIQQYISLSDLDWQTISDFLIRCEVPKDTLLLKEGMVCRHVYFLETGLVRFFILKNGNDITKYFTEIPYCFTSIKSFSNQQPALENIETLEDCVLWRMSYKDSQHLLRLPTWASFTRLLVQEVQVLTDEILQEMQTETAETRYRQMLLNNDSLLQRVPLKHLASYLGIAPQSLSRIRKNLPNALRN
jgi:CRP-like cAMP-binding protein